MACIDARGLRKSLGLPIAVAIALNRRVPRRNAGQRPFRWGYYFSIESLFAGIGLGMLLDSGMIAVLLSGAFYGALAWFFAQRHHWAWITLTILSFNPVAWLINLIYLRKRWAENAVNAPST